MFKKIKLRKLTWAKHQQRWFGKWHLYLGIIAGAIVAIVGITGSILVFRDKIDRTLNPQLFEVLAKQHKMSIGEAAEIFQKKYPQYPISYISGEDTSATASYQAYCYKTQENVFINPYDGSLCGKRLYESAFINIVMDIHRTLLIPVVGQYIVCVAALCLFILTVSGLRLWVPAKWKQLKTVLTVNFKASAKRQNYDWHNVLGFYSAPVVTFLTLTGIGITLYAFLLPTFYAMNGQSPKEATKPFGSKSVYAAHAVKISPANMVTIGEKDIADARVQGMSLPLDSTGTYVLYMNTGKKLPRSGKLELLTYDQYSGKILFDSRKDISQAGNAFFNWLTPLHYGSFGGLPTQILALICGLIPAALFVTGFIIWLPRYRKQKKNKVLNKEENLPRMLRKKDILPTSLSLKQYIFKNCKNGLKYALWFAFISAVMGMLYGLLSGIVLQPAVFIIVYSAVLVLLNFIVAFCVLFVSIIVLAPFKKNIRFAIRYFLLSFAFLVVYGILYLLLMKTGLKVF
ncbi:hypothetical protein A9P82_04155 [Arachidicoccus ginsenosidimutans]|uniref:PepSY-associated TM helix domain-containing protein n=1 Tax=Arachidicoccus sp. BS20 TaxID=1850526 RepID=UPI0007F0B001|nr:PepSY-associated TM helix domain-containing protein [Arachidicoccus sp. BS20]ANI88557.1 hypothetical protein A9P82_04155 [Arachidicoccus sp. BS20]